MNCFVNMDVWFKWVSIVHVVFVSLYVGVRVCLFVSVC